MRTRRHRMTRAQRLAAIVTGFFFVMPLVILLFGSIVQHLWNWLMPAIFHLPTLRFTQAVGLMFLSWILFGLRGVGSPRGRRGWRRELMHLTPEERERLLQAVEAKYGERPPFGDEGAVG